MTFDVTEVDLVESDTPIQLPEPWLPAWRAPGGTPTESLRWKIVRVHTDAGLTGIAPAAGTPQQVDADALDPARVGELWQTDLSGARADTANGVASVEIALWDALGKHTGRPIHELLGGTRDRVPVYGATSRLPDPDDLADQVQTVRDAGFQGAKVRLHRDDPAADVNAVRTVRDAVGDDFPLYVDANQNNPSPGYDHWSRRTARQVATELDAIGVDVLEEPLPRRDVDGLASIADAVTLDVAGGEHSAAIYDFRPHLERGAYDVIQPDVVMNGNHGIGGLHRAAVVADFYDRPVIPHVTGNATTGLNLAATLQVAGAVDNIPLVEFPYDPPVLTPDTTQPLTADPLSPDDDGTLQVPDGPGLGIDIDHDELEEHGTVVWTSN